MEIDWLNILKISGLTTLIITPITSFISYKFGQRTKIDDEKLKIIINDGREIYTKIQEIHETYLYLNKTFERNFGHFHHFEEACERFQNYNQFDNEKKIIKKLSEKENYLSDKIKDVRLFLDNNFLEKIEQYILLGRFYFQHDSIGSHNNYYEKLFENIKQFEEKRIDIFKKIKKRGKNLLK